MTFKGYLGGEWPPGQKDDFLKPHFTQAGDGRTRLGTRGVDDRQQSQTEDRQQLAILLRDAIPLSPTRSMLG